jgi:hypothetical protein
MRFNVIDLLSRVKLPARVFCSIMSIPPGAVFLSGNDKS